ncbi:MAG: NYN domain-containing protein [Gracilibacteraceae bacterium]|nr:NYN domain-containing protein [Gracilibacteraceae bacterium]
MDDEKKFAVLIDADNISERYIKFILDEISNEGVATYKRIYGDWTTPNLKNWKAALIDNSILPFQQFAYTSGKNATDSAMIIDAMDIFYSGRVNGFCIVSSDSDFTRLAARLREGGMIVIGMGESKTPKSFISACNRFKYLDILATESAKADIEEKQAESKNVVRLKTDADKAGLNSTAAKSAVSKSAASKRTIKTAILSITAENSDDNGWLNIGELGNKLVKRYPDFDVRNFNFSKLSMFVQSLDYLVTKKVQNGVYIKIREG